MDHGNPKSFNIQLGRTWPTWHTSSNEFNLNLSHIGVKGVCKN